MLDVLQLDREAPALILKLGGQSVHHGTLGIIRSIGRLGVPVHAIVDHRFSPAAASRYLTSAFVWEGHHWDAEPPLDFLAMIGERLGRRAVLIPTNDFTATLIAEHAEALQNWYTFPQVPPTLPRQLSNKREMYHLCRNIGVPCPEVVVPTSQQEMQTFLEGARYPVVVKAAESERLPRGAASTVIAHTPHQLMALYRQVECARPNLILQEYIPQSCSEDWIFHGYCNSRTNCFIGFTGKKVRSYPPFAGITTLGVSIWNETLFRQAEKLLQTIRYSGIVDLDYRLDKRDGQYKLLDFNPRIGANFRMFENRAGIDVVRALHLDLTGRVVPQAPMLEGRKFLVEPYDLLAALGYFRRDGLTLRTWRESLKGTKELAWFRWDDPVPFLSMCASLAIAMPRRAVRKMWVPLETDSTVPRPVQKLAAAQIEQPSVRERH